MFKLICQLYYCILIRSISGSAYIMYEHCGFANIICMEICNFKVVNCNWRFKNLMLHLLDYNIFAALQNKDIART